MPRVGVRDLKNRASEILRSVREEGAEYVITYQGRPTAVLLPVDEQDLDDFLLAHHPHFVERRERARQAIREGEFAGAQELTDLAYRLIESSPIGEATKDMAERHSIRQRFWAGLLERAQARTSLHASISPRDQGWAATGAGKTGLSFSYFSRQHDSRAELYIYAGKESRDRNKAIFDELIAQREKVESLFGGPLEWQRLDRKCACRIRKVIDAGGYRDPEEDWPRIQDAMIDAMIRLEKSLKGPIAALRV